MRKLTVLIFLFVSAINAQNDSIFTDMKYLDDQIYANVTYIKLLNLPEPITQNGFSYGLGVGVIKDLPVNKKRNIGFGVGLGYGFNVNYFNVKEYIPIELESDSNKLKSNKVSLHNVEIPLELRFRTSTPEKYKFWRIYAGFKFSYAFATNNKLRQREDFDVEKIIKINRFQYGPMISMGYNKWNLHVYYGLNELFTNTKENAYTIGIHDLRMGLIFYIF